MATQEGNVCRNKFGRGDPCSDNQQCLSDQCTLILCVEDECLGPLITEECLSDQFCMATQEGKCDATSSVGATRAATINSACRTSAP